MDETSSNRMIVWIFYYLGVTDGMSASLETFKTLNPEPVNDAEWQTKLRSYLPPELAALRRPDGNREAAIRIMEQEIRLALHRTKRRSRKTSKRE